MAESDPLHSLHTTVHCYLATLLAAADCVGDACPPVGGPYRTRLKRLKSRLAFDSSAEAVEESAAIVASDLKDYSAHAAAYLESHAAGFRRTLSGLDETLRVLGQRQEFYAARLRQLAAQLEYAPPSDPENPAEAMALPSEVLLRAVESMTYEMQSLASRLQSELRVAERVVAEAETTDPVTGLMNRHEMERRIADYQASGEPYALLLFTVTSDVGPEILTQVGVRLTQQFRHNDRVARWGAREFLVLFAAPPAIAEIRLPQILPWIAGRYLLDHGDPVEVALETRTLTEAVPA